VCALLLLLYSAVTEGLLELTALTIDWARNTAFGVEEDNKCAHTFSINIFMFGLQTLERNHIILLFVHVRVGRMYYYVSSQNTTISIYASVFVKACKGS